MATMTKAELLQRLWAVKVQVPYNRDFENLVDDIVANLPDDSRHRPFGDSSTEFLRLAKATDAYDPHSWTTIADRILAKIDGLAVDRHLAIAKIRELEVQVEAVKIQRDQAVADAEGAKAQVERLEGCRSETYRRSMAAFGRVGERLGLGGLGGHDWEEKAVAIIDAIDDLEQEWGDRFRDAILNNVKPTVACLKSQDAVLNIPPGFLAVVGRAEDLGLAEPSVPDEGLCECSY